MAYHSAFKEEDAAAFACGCAVLPIKTSCRGPAPSLAADKEDIIDEVLFYFKANVLFRNFEVRGPADRLLVYLTLYVTECLKKIESAPSRADATKSLTNMALELFTIPGDANFALAPYFPAPENKQEADFVRGYFRQLREETGRRLLDKCYIEGETKVPSKWWTSFSKRRFMNKAI
ncbi:actin-related protein 2/3 complex subunit 3 [Pavlovales sp. CCMP2436]|nr:actin-related protein 2/3 complex subunit 3 [Pavlovales sp. CCMP2436]|mmetsp:Transcript_17811/g.45581  ORF Transcript_17811/g.45581 Transcript_17811/m.45581 type:complete len:176 (+) Transcript_17811:157-684(+)